MTRRNKEEVVVVNPPPSCTADEFQKYANTYKEGLSEEKNGIYDTRWNT